MEEREPVLAKLFKTHSGRVFVYDGLSSRIISVDGNWSAQNETELSQTIFPALLRQGLLPKGSRGLARWNISSGEYWHLLYECLPALELQTTRECNLRCDYCVYSGHYRHMRPHAAEHMSLEMMMRSVDFYASHSRSTSNAEIAFYGGEPLIRFAEIRQVTEYAKGLFSGRKLDVSISSNATLITREVCQWLEKNPQIKLTITLNGPFQNQDRRFPSGQGSLDAVMKGVKQLQEKYPSVWEEQVSLIANFSSYGQIPQIRRFYQEYIGKAPVMLNRIQLSMGDKTIQDNYCPKEATEEEYFSQLQEEYKERPDDFTKALFDAHLELLDKRELFSPHSDMRISTCAPFSIRLFVQTDGTFHVCERTPDYFCLGDLKRGFDFERITRVMDDMQALVNQNCRVCWMQRLCLLCFQDMVDEYGRIPQHIPPQLCRGMEVKLLNMLRLYCELYG